MGDYHNDTNAKDEEYYMKLNNFYTLKELLTAWEIKSIAGNQCFQQTMFPIDNESGKKIKDELMNRL